MEIDVLNINHQKYICWDRFSVIIKNCRWKFILQLFQWWFTNFSLDTCTFRNANLWPRVIKICLRLATTPSLGLSESCRDKWDSEGLVPCVDKVDYYFSFNFNFTIWVRGLYNFFFLNEWEFNISKSVYSLD